MTVKSVSEFSQHQTAAKIDFCRGNFRVVNQKQLKLESNCKKKMAYQNTSLELTHYERYPNHWTMCISPLTCRSLGDWRISFKDEFRGYFKSITSWIVTWPHSCSLLLRAAMCFREKAVIAVCGKSHKGQCDWLTQAKAPKIKFGTLKTRTGKKPRGS